MSRIVTVYSSAIKSVVSSWDDCEEESVLTLDKNIQMKRAKNKFMP